MLSARCNKQVLNDILLSNLFDSGKLYSINDYSLSHCLSSNCLLCGYIIHLLCNMFMPEYRKTQIWVGICLSHVTHSWDKISNTPKLEGEFFILAHSSMVNGLQRRNSVVEGHGGGKATLYLGGQEAERGERRSRRGRYTFPDHHLGDPPFPTRPHLLTSHLAIPSPWFSHLLKTPPMSTWSFFF